MSIAEPSEPYRVPPRDLAGGSPNHDVEAFAEHGYVIVRQVVDEAARADLSQRVDSIVASGATGDAAARQVQMLRGRDRTLRMAKVSQLMRTSAPFRRLAHRPEIVDVVEALAGEGARAFRDVVVVKPARTGGSLSMHQDSAYWDVTPMALVSAWVALTDAPVAASCLSVVPGSHDGLRPHGLVVRGRWRVPTPVTNGLRRLVSAAGTGDNPDGAGGNVALWKAKRAVLAQATTYVPALGDLQDFHVLADDMPRTPVLDLPIAAGDAIFFHSLLIHGTGPNTADTTRAAAIVSYMPPGARCGDVDPDGFPLARTQEPAA